MLEDFYIDRASRLIPPGMPHIEAVAAVAMALKEERELALNSSVERRLAQAFLQLEAALKDGDVAITMSQTEMARSIGASRSYVCTTIGSWMRANIIQRRGRRIFIKKHGALQRLAKV